MRRVPRRLPFARFWELRCGLRRVGLFFFAWGFRRGASRPCDQLGLWECRIVCSVRRIEFEGSAGAGVGVMCGEAGSLQKLRIPNYVGG